MTLMATPPPPISATWHQGWCPWASHQPSPNQGPRPLGLPIDLLVIHSISLPPGQYGTGCVQAFFMNQLDLRQHPYFQTLEGLRVSAHFLIERTGALWQFVSAEQRAWHAGQSCFSGRPHCNDFSIGIELEGLEGDSFEEAQYDTLGRLSLELTQVYPSLLHAAGHEDIAPGRKQDPGPGFDWPKAQSLGLLPRANSETVGKRPLHNRA